MYLYISDRWLEDFIQVTMYEWECIKRDRSVAAVNIHRRETTVLVRPTEEKRTTSMGP
jgi:hypothetical protein